MNSRPHDSATKKDSGFHLIGFLSGAFGLGECARNTLKTLVRGGYPIDIRDLDTGDHRTGQMKDVGIPFEKRGDYWPHPINLFHINPLELESMAIPQWYKIPLADRLNTIVPFWELPMLPSEWLPCLRAMDCILAPSKFIQEIFQQELPEKPILYFPQYIPAGELTPPHRALFNLPEDAFIFLCAFDAMSGMERKNPWGAITAFQQAFPETPNVRLALKISNPRKTNCTSDALEKLEKIAAKDSRILLLKETLSREALQQLYASCDALVSLHRAEGLGLIIMEMMAQAKPVIVTAWSGNMDFTTPENSCLVDFLLAPVQTTHPAYQEMVESKTVCWAEANTTTAANWMKKLISDTEFCQQIGNNGRTSMLERETFEYSPLFDQLHEQYKLGLHGNKEALRYFKTVRKAARKRKRRSRVRKIERAVKQLFR